MKMDVLHRFGSRWFCLQMQHFLEAQTRTLGEILECVKDDKFIEVLPLAVAIRETALAICALRDGNHLSEAHILMRLLVERTINFCFLLGKESQHNNSSQKSQSNNSSQASIDSGKVLSVDNFINMSKEFRFAESYDWDEMEKKLKAVSQRLRVPEASLRFSIVVHYTKASMAMNGSLAGAICHLMSAQKIDGEMDPEFFQKEFALIFCSAVSLLDNVIVAISQGRPITELLKQSNDTSGASLSLMKRTKEPVNENVLDMLGMWQTLKDYERFACENLKRSLESLETAFALCIETGMTVPNLKYKNRGILRRRLSALFLRRILNDLRSVWLTVSRGHTSPAGSITASIYEYSLAVMCIAESDSMANELNRNRSGELPWGVSKMCRKLASRRKANGETALNFETDWRVEYHPYKWLCSIKHPTMAQMIHDAGVNEKGNYVLMPMPDIRPGDLNIKLRISLLAVWMTYRAIQAFAKGADIESDTEDAKLFNERMQKIYDIVSTNLEKVENKTSRA
jgi:hypothetical protein